MEIWQGRREGHILKLFFNSSPLSPYNLFFHFARKFEMIKVIIIAVLPFSPRGEALMRLSGSEMIRVQSFSMRLLCFYIAIAAMIAFLPQLSYGNQRDSSAVEVKHSGLRWEREHLEGELRNVSVEDLLREISLMGGFELEMKGKANQTIDISFQRLTLHEGIKKLMRSAALNYAIEWDPDESNTIRKLIVYPKGGADSRRLSPVLPEPRQGRVEEPIPAVEIEESETLQEPQDPPSNREREVEDEAEKEKAFEGSREDLESYVDQLVKDEKIDKEEYQKILEKLEEKHR
jgi:hypothetical protein